MLQLAIDIKAIHIQIAIVYYAIFVISSVLVWWLQLRAMGNSTTTAKPIILFTGANFVAIVRTSLGVQR